MADATPVEQQIKPPHPTKETIRHLRHQIDERRPQAEKIAKKSGQTPTNRMLNNIAGELLRKDAEAGTDPLTQLWNLKGYKMRQEEELSRAARTHQPMSVVVADANGLKEINDKLGHERGDQLLRDIAKILREESRAADVIARVGGDEYRVLLPETDINQAQQWHERVKEALAKNGLSLSIGIAQVDIANIDESTRLADERMYDDKRKHKEQKDNSAK